MEKQKIKVGDKTQFGIVKEITTVKDKKTGATMKVALFNDKPENAKSLIGLRVVNYTNKEIMAIFKRNNIPFERNSIGGFDVNIGKIPDYICLHRLMTINVSA